MVTFSFPIRRDNAIVGVVTLDLSVKYFEVLRRWLDELRIGKHATASSSADPASSLATRTATTDFARAREGHAPRLTDMAGSEGGDADFAQLLAQPATGSRSVVDPATGKRSAFLFAPVPSADWKFVAVVECDESAAACG